MMIGRPFRALKAPLQDSRGVSVIEFALMLPLLVFIGFSGLEFVNYILANQKIERIASVTADNVARNTLAPTEQSFVDTFAAVNKIASPFNVLQNGRIIMTGVIGVPVNGAIVGKVVWQRCSGSLTGVSSVIGAEAVDPTKWAFGPNASLPNNITLLQNQLVVVSEVVYRYEPMINTAQLPFVPGDGTFRQQSIFVSRGQAFPYVTPSPNVAPASCR
jgi:Flp pilus assembly protein TadG